MSTKIYYGCRASRDVDLFTLAAGIRQSVTEAHTKVILTKIAEQVTKIIDRDTISGVRRGLENDWHPAMTACLEFRKEQEELNSDYALHDPYRFEAQIIPSGDYWYILPFFLEETFHEALLAVDGIEDYAYWDNSDGPDELTEEAWMERRDTWDAVPGIDYGAVGEHGVSVGLGVQNSLYPTLIEYPDRVADYQPSLEERTRSIISYVADRHVALDIDRIFESLRKFNRGVEEAFKLDPPVVTGLVTLTQDMITGNEQHPDIQVDFQRIIKTVQESAAQSGRE